MPSGDLRRLMWATPALAGAAYEAVEQGIDKAQAILIEGLRHENLGRRLEAAAYILRHSAAARRRVMARSSS